VMRVVSREGAAGVRWFRTQLVRAGRKDQESLRRLFAKVETQGFESLSAAERGELTQLLRRMEQSLTVKLDNDAKNALRAKAKKDFFDVFHPELAGILKYPNGRPYDVHHLIPLEYSHLFPKLDINASTNLVAVGQPVHQGINKVWTAFRTKLGSSATPEQVQRMEDITRRHFGRWFNKVHASPDPTPELDRATAAALEDVMSWIAEMRR
jgi:hypothetical protein